jgi:acyl carrier protein
MSKDGFLRALERLLSARPGSLNEAEHLSELGNWDSLAILGFLGFMDRELGIDVNTRALADCQTVGDLMGLAGGRLS